MFYDNYHTIIAIGVVLSLKPNLAFKVLTTAALFSSLALPAYAAPASFSDIDSSYAKDAITQLVQQGIINGVGSGKFNPTDKIERQDFAVILAKALQLDTANPPAKASFTDIPTDHYAYAYVEAAVKAGLIKGIGNGAFGASSNLTRQDMAVMFVRALGVDATGKGKELQFSDAAAISDYAKDAVAAAVELGLIQGNADGSFNPKESAERQAVAAVASRFLKAEDEIRNSSDSTPPPEEPAPSQPPVNSDTGNNSGSYTPPSNTLSAPTTIGFDGADKLKLTYGSVLGAVYSTDDFHVSIGEGETANPIEPKSIQIVGNTIEITLPEPIWNGKKYTVAYLSESNKPVRSETGALSPAYTVSEVAALPGDVRQWLQALVDVVSPELVSAQVAPDTRDGLTGEYPSAAFNDLHTAIESASSVLDESGADSTSLLDAYDTLHASLASFHAAQVKPLSVLLVPDQTIWVSSMPPIVTSPAVTISDQDGPLKRNINSLIQVRRGGESAGSLTYSSGSGFEVGNTDGEVVGYISSNDSFNVTLESDGFYITPEDEVTDGYYSIPFDVTESGEPVANGHVDLPVILDRTPTSVTSAVYGDDVITLQMNEGISASVPPTIALRYSPSGDFSDGSSDAVNLDSTADYSIEVDDSQISIRLTESGLAKLDSVNGQFQITITGVTDQYGIVRDLAPYLVSSADTSEDAVN